MDDNTNKMKSRRLSKEQRRQQLLDTALGIVRTEGADSLTLGHLAKRAGVSKPVAYDHFGTRSRLLVELYRLIDQQQSKALRNALSADEKSFTDTARVLANAHIHCYADTSGEWHAIGAALAGSEDKEVVYQELLDNYVQLFVETLKPFCERSDADIERRCLGLIGAGDALAAAMVRGRCSETEAAEAFAALMEEGMSSSAN